MKNTLDFSSRGTAYCLPLDKINAIANKNSTLMIYMEGNKEPMAWDDDFEGKIIGWKLFNMA